MRTRILAALALLAGLTMVGACTAQHDNTGWQKDSDHVNNTRGEADTGQLGHSSDTPTGTLHGN